VGPFATIIYESALEKAERSSSPHPPETQRTSQVEQQAHILVVDDDLEIRKLLGRYLTAQNFSVTLASDKRTLTSALEANIINLIVLDVMLPDASGLDICRHLREAHSPIPIILLTALKEDVDRIIGLEIGADDYLGKPFNPRELVARIRAVLRRTPDTDEFSQKACGYRFVGFQLQPALRCVLQADGSRLELTSAEFDLLLVLVTRPGRILSRDTLLDLTNRDGSDALDRSVDVLLSRLRRKLGDQDFAIIQTVRNEGYVFTAPVEKVSCQP
jgi:two-component system OmpR family response regulator